MLLPTEQAIYTGLQTAIHPNQEPIFGSVKFQEAGRYFIRVFVDWRNGETDSATRDVCPEEESHAVFVEVEDEIIASLRRKLELKKLFYRR